MNLVNMIPQVVPQNAGGSLIDRDRIADFCRKHHIRKLALFGSVLTDEFRPESNIDVLVEFEAAGRVFGFLSMAGLELELAGMLGRKVDLRTAAELSRYFRDSVLATSEIQYAEG
jgi:hypothetical protein